MRRRLPYESKELLAELALWVEWRYANSKERLVLTSAPTSLPSTLETWMPEAVWRLAWFQSGSAILFGLAPGSGPRRYFVVRHDAVKAQREGIFEKQRDGSWSEIDGDNLEPEAKVRLPIIVRRDVHYRARRRAGAKERAVRNGGSDV
jgi:hypothetical protein